MSEITSSRIESTKSSIQKLTKKIDRINAALGGGKNPYYYDESDLRRANQELQEAEERLHKWEAKLVAEEKEAGEPRIEAVETFLENWKCSAREYYNLRITEYRTYRAERTKKRKALENEFRSKGIFLYGKEMHDAEKEAGIDYDSSRQYVKSHFDALVVDIVSRGAQGPEFLEKSLDDEVKRKRRNLIARVKKVTGTIIDASGLYIAGNFEINGVVIGENGKARVTTISAGGWNVQCLHFRVLVKSL